jgi:LmbE family N-acetylglucosaminyl deacetylase
MARHVKEGAQVYLLILGEGITSRFSKRESGLGSKELGNLKKFTGDAANILGVKKTYTHDLPDNRFDSVDLLDIVKEIEKVKNEVKPNIVYTHHRGDLNIDHRITFDAVMTACRPVDGETVKEIYSFEVPSSTEWNFPNSFQPNVYVDISDTVKTKTAAMKAYKSEIRKWPHPRSEEAIMVLAKKRGCEAGLFFAESFEAIRQIV